MSCTTVTAHEILFALHNRSNGIVITSTRAVYTYRRHNPEFFSRGLYDSSNNITHSFVRVYSVEKVTLKIQKNNLFHCVTNMSQWTRADMICSLLKQ